MPSDKSVICKSPVTVKSGVSLTGRRRGRKPAPTCDTMHTHALARARQVERVAQVHRDPFEPILPILEADSPVAEYRKITEEIIATMPDGRRYPRQANNQCGPLSGGRSTTAPSMAAMNWSVAWLQVNRRAKVAASARSSSSAREVASPRSSASAPT